MESTIPSPTHPCRLLAPAASRYSVLNGLQWVEDYFVSETESQSLVQCKECGQLYFQDWREVTRYFDHDGMWEYRLIPVADAQEAEALQLQAGSEREKLPALMLAWPPEEVPRWVNR